MKKNTSWIAKFSSFFTRKKIVTLSLFVVILGLGTTAYTTLLKREGFPAVQFPFVVVQAPYFAGDVDVVNNQITKPLEESILNVDSVTKLQTTTTDNFALFVVQFNEELTSQEGGDAIQNQIEKDVSLPEGAQLNYDIIDVGSIDGTHDLLFSLVANKPTAELEQKAAEVAKKLRENENVTQVTVKNLITTQIDPTTGQSFEYQATFNRVGVRTNGTVEFKPAIDIGIVKKDEVGTIEISEAIRRDIDEMKKNGVLEGYEVTYGGDTADILNTQITSLEQNAISGLLVVVAVLFLLVNWRASIVTAIFIPTVMLATFVALYAFGYTLNVISLFALILVLGLFVDDAIVVVEAIDYQKKQGKKGLEAVKDAVSGIGSADVMGTITTVLVFAPMAFISGVLGEFIRQVPVTVILALVLSLIIALSIIPFFSNVIITDNSKETKPKGLLSKIGYYTLYGIPNFVRYISEKVAALVSWYLGKWYTLIAVVVITFVVVALGSMYAQKLKFNIFPAAKDGDQMSATINFAPETQLQQRIEITKDIEKELVEQSGKYISRVDYFNDPQSPETANMSILLKEMDSRDKTSVTIAEGLNEAFSGYDKARVKVSSTSIGPPEGDFQFMMQIYSDDLNTLKEIAPEVRKYLEENDFGDTIEITEVAVDGLFAINKLDGKQYAQVNAKIADTENTGIVLELIDDIKAEFDNDRLGTYGLSTDNIEFDLGQESENLESFNSLMTAGLVSLGMMYILLVVQFKSLLQPILIFLAIPLSFPGVFMGLYATENPLSFFVAVGMIGLIGIVVNNSIMLVDFANQAKRDGSGIKESMVQAVKIRFRPLVTTSVTTVVGLLPLALSDPIWESLAFTIIFGLISSTTLVIFVFPAFYAVVTWVGNVFTGLLPFKR